MAKMEIKGIEEYIGVIEKMPNGEEYARKIAYAGAEVMADAMRIAISKIPEAEADKRGHPVRNQSGKIRGVTKQQRQDLEKGFGVTKMERKGDIWNVKVGFGGYGSEKTKKHPKGIPNGMLAQVVTSGNSFRVKSPILRTTQIRMKKPTLLAMEKAAEKIIREKIEK